MQVQSEVAAITLKLFVHTKKDIERLIYFLHKQKRRNLCLAGFFARNRYNRLQMSFKGHQLSRERHKGYCDTAVILT